MSDCLPAAHGNVRTYVEYSSDLGLSRGSCFKEFKLPALYRKLCLNKIYHLVFFFKLLQLYIEVEKYICVSDPGMSVCRVTGIFMHMCKSFPLMSVLS